MGFSKQCVSEKVQDKMVQWVKTPTAKPDNLGLISRRKPTPTIYPLTSTHVPQHTHAGIHMPRNKNVIKTTKVD